MVSEGSSHLFLCRDGQMLPRWSEAFEGAKASKPGTLRSKKGKSTVGLLWLRLEQDVSAAEQVAGVALRFGVLPCIVMSDIPQDEEAMAVFSAGARGYCNTHADPKLLRQIAGVVLQGGLWIGESLMQRLIGATARLARAAPLTEASLSTGLSGDLSPPATAPPAAPAWQEKLTDREREVAQTLASGASNKEIARLLGITDRTVKAHVGAILEKLQVRDRLQLSLVINGGARVTDRSDG
ncbi:response regulator transcription factor [Polaromonas sp. YR568]|uniref:helix-turn-helix transcriptional regulator n=1 Tax=Polaromonas sp. YR568 TaxID=1855301 RepID=UPI003137B599